MTEMVAHTMSAVRQELTVIGFAPVGRPMSKEAGIRTKLLALANKHVPKATSNARAAVSVAKSVKDQPKQFAEILKRDGAKSTAKRLKRMHELRVSVRNRPLGA